MNIRKTTVTVIGSPCSVCGNTIRYRTSRNCCNCFSEKSRKTRLKRNFNISIDDYNLYLKNQNGKCAICGIDKCKTGRRFAVDHKHGEHKHIRGLLCKECNIGLGNFRDDPELLMKAIEYLKESENARNSPCIL